MASTSWWFTQHPLECHTIIWHAINTLRSCKENTIRDWVRLTPKLSSSVNAYKGLKCVMECGLVARGQRLKMLVWNKPWYRDKWLSFVAMVCTSEFRFSAETAIFPHLHDQTRSRVHSLSYTMDIRGIYPGLKQPQREAEDLCPCSSEVNNACSCTSTPLNHFLTWCINMGMT